MARFRSKVADLKRVGRDLEGVPSVRVILENGVAFMIVPDPNGVSGWSVDHSWTGYTNWTGPDIIVLYDDLKRVRFCGSDEAHERYREAFAYT